jgi:hypothetical protein
MAHRKPAVQQGIAMGHRVVVGHFARTHAPRDGRALVRWLDGEVAATEAPFGAGCVRDVAIPVDAAGDVALRESFRGIVAALTALCGDAWRAPGDTAAAGLATLLPAGDRPRATPPAVAGVGRLPVWLALAALAVLLLEQAVRRRLR